MSFDQFVIEFIKAITPIALTLIAAETVKHCFAAFLLHPPRNDDD